MELSKTLNRVRLFSFRRADENMRRKPSWCEQTTAAELLQVELGARTTQGQLRLSLLTAGPGHEGHFMYLFAHCLLRNEHRCLEVPKDMTEPHVFLQVAYP